MPELTAADLAVVIPTQNRWSVLERTVRALRAQSAAGAEIVVVVDTGADPPSWLEGCRVLMRRGSGVGAARNTGTEATARPVVVFLGDDTIPEPDLLARHLAVHRRRPEAEVGVLGLVEWHPEVARGRLQRWLDWSGTQFDYRTIVGEEAGWGRLYSSNVSLKREFLLGNGGFDEDFLFGYEDIELGLRLHGKGLRLLFEPAARVWHVHRYVWPAIEGRFRLVGGGEYLMTRKHPAFAPFFLEKLTTRGRVAPGSVWPWVVDHVPEGRDWRLRRTAEAHADWWYSKRLTPAFMAGWRAAEEIDDHRRLAEPGEVWGTGAAAEPEGAFETYLRLADDIARQHRYLGELVPLLGGRRILCASSGSLTVGLELLERGYDVTFADESERGREMARRRLKFRGHPARVCALEEIEPSDRFDGVLAFHLEALTDPTGALELLEEHGALLAVAAPGVGGANRPLSTPDLVRRARRRGVVRHRSDPSGRDVLVYRGRPGGTWAPPAGGVVERLVGKALSRHRPWFSVPSAP